MEIVCRLIIITSFLLSSLHLVCCLPNTSSSKYCDIMTCNSESRMYNSSIKFPFHLKDLQPESCGPPQFELYCNEQLGTLLELPDAGNFTVDNIYYNSNLIELFDPNKCLAMKLISLNLTKTPFRQRTYSREFSLYNCSGGGNYSRYDQIGCLSGTDHTVISAEPGVRVVASNCTLLTSLAVPADDSTNLTRLSSLSKINLTWDDPKCYSCGGTKTRISQPNSSPGSLSSWVIGPIWGLSLLLVVIFGSCCLTCLQPLESTYEIQRRSTTAIHGLDQITIDSYPTVVLGESLRLVKPGDDMCPICLSCYLPSETLKTLPDCCHCFHADCIDQWLRSKAICPICRSTPSPDNPS